MSNTISIAIPVRKHLQKFAEKEFASRLSMKDRLGITIYYMLQKSKGDKPDAELMSKYPALLKFEVAEFYLMRKIISPYLDSQAIIHLDSVLDYDFKRELFRYVNQKAMVGVDRQIAIEEMCDKYDIHNTDISFEALKKAEYRYRLTIISKAA